MLQCYGSGSGHVRNYLEQQRYHPDDVFLGGGVAVLVHLRRAGRAKVQVWREWHALGVCLRLESPEAVGVLSAQLPPKMDPDDRTRVCKEVVTFLERSGANYSFL